MLAGCKPMGKLRRYFDLKNFTDPFRVLKGFGEAKKSIVHFVNSLEFRLAHAQHTNISEENIAIFNLML